MPKRMRSFESMPSLSLPPVTVLCGFLGAGKTTLLRHVLGQAEGRRWAAVVNDVAAINIDARLVQDAGAQRVVELGNGCVCCTVKDELAETIAELCATGDYEHVWVETTGVAEPRAIADLFVRKNVFGRSLGDFAHLHALVTVIDAAAFLAGWRDRKVQPAPTDARALKPVFELLVEQAECADLLVLNKCDMLSEAQLSELEIILRGLNERAEIVRTEHGQLPVELLVDRPRFDPIATPGAARWVRVLNQVAGSLVSKTPGATHESKYGITTFVYQARAPWCEDKLKALLAEPIPGLLRAKGFYWVAQRPDDMGFLSLAGGIVRQGVAGTWAAALLERGLIKKHEIPEPVLRLWVEPDGDRRQELVFIGVGLEDKILRTKLDTCMSSESLRSSHST